MRNRPVSLLTLQVSLDVAARPSINRSVLNFNVTEISPKIKVVHSAIGLASEIQRLVNFVVNNVAIQQYIIPELNKAGQRGIPLLKLDDVQFTNAALQLHNNAITVSTDVRYRHSK
jgi:hypothetical protein